MSIKPSESFIDKGRADQLLSKWAPILEHSSASVAPITNDHTKLSTAILLENQEKWCLRESSYTSINTAGDGGVFGATLQGSPGQGGKFSSDFYASGDARLPKVLIPMIRRTFPELVTNEIVGVQPMSGPVGLAFALRFQYDAQNLSDYTYDGSSSLNNGPRPTAAESDAEEIGWNYLNTAFTGTSSAGLSGLGVNVGSDFDFVQQDQGVAEILKNFELTGGIPQMTLDFFKTAVEAGTRRLAARWSVELEQDIKNMNGIDIDNELTNAMSYEIQAEIDREMVMRMVQSALKAGSGQGYSYWSPVSADGRWLGERNRDFYQKIIVEANRVAIRNRRGAANFIVATPRVTSILEMLPEFAFMPVNGNVNTAPVGIAKVGTLGGRFTVYRDTRTDAQYQVGLRSAYLEYALLGYKGPEFYDTGIVYCPYIPVMVQRTIGPNDFSPRVGLMTRYGVVDNIFGSNLYYHVIIVKGLGTVFTPGTQSAQSSWRCQLHCCNPTCNINP